MTDDIVARLREWSDNAKEQDAIDIVVGLCAAADEIERLREERNEAEPLLNELWERRTEATEMRSEIERLRRRLLAEENAYDIERRQNEHLQTDRNNLELEVERLRKERDEARLQTRRILNEIDCRIEHGAESNGHLEAIRNLFTEEEHGKTTMG